MQPTKPTYIDLQKIPQFEEEESKSPLFQFEHHGSTAETDLSDHTPDTQTF